MMEAPNHILNGFKKRWQLLLCLEVLLYGLGATLLSYFLFLNVFFAGFICITTSVIAFLIIKPWQPNLEKVSSYVDTHLSTVNYSTGLLLIEEDKLSGLAKLQHYKTTEEIKKKLNKINPPHHIKRTLIICGCLLIVSVLLYLFGPITYGNEQKLVQKPLEKIVFTATDSTTSVIPSPEIKKQWVTVQYPSYTGMSSVVTEIMDIKALEGSQLTWSLQFDTAIKNVSIESDKTDYAMQLEGEIYKRKALLENSGFYNFRFRDKQDRIYTSDLHSIEMLKDNSPLIKIVGLKQFTTFSYDESKQLSVKALLRDDYGIANAYIIATVSKGSGESVKFREEKLQFDTPNKVGARNVEMSKFIDLDQMKMEPGDELYFYVEVLDGKKPKPNKSRSETFFAIIKDTISDQFAVQGTMGADLMPDYFRSQRQLIIDTEKLIKDKSKLSNKEYKSKSNELGFDQKALRLKYGEFMGDESEYGAVVQEESMPSEDAHDHQEEEKDPLAGYTHDHDGDNDHNLVANKEEHTKEDPLEEYLHNHDDPEESTLFTQSLKSKLRQALNQMWDAELHLRLYTPDKSLPFQYKALKLIQEIKNSARIYVHRIGFDPPPIKEDKRLSGKLDKVFSYTKKEQIEIVDQFPAMRNTIVRLEQFIQGSEKITNDDIVLFTAAGDELAQIAIENSGKYLETLQQLKNTIERREVSKPILIKIQQGLIAAIPDVVSNPRAKEMLWSELNQLLLKELETYE